MRSTDSRPDRLDDRQRARGRPARRAAWSCCTASAVRCAGTTPCERLADAFRVVRLDLLGHGVTGGAAADAPEQAAWSRRCSTGSTSPGSPRSGTRSARTSSRSSRAVAAGQSAGGAGAGAGLLRREIAAGRVIMTVPGVARVLHRVLPVGRASPGRRPAQPRGRAGRSGGGRLAGARPGHVPHRAGRAPRTDGAAPAR